MVQDQAVLLHSLLCSAHLGWPNSAQPREQVPGRDPPCLSAALACPLLLLCVIGQESGCAKARLIGILPDLLPVAEPAPFVPVSLLFARCFVLFALGRSCCPAV